MASGAPRGTRSTDAADARSAIDGVAARPARARNVRTILRLEAQAQRLLARYERTLDVATRAKAQAYTLLDEAHSLECSLTAPQLEALWRGRADAAGAESAGGAASAAEPATTTPA